jgi:hypothetical protein
VRDPLVHRDSSLDDRHLPCSTEEEFEGYIWDDATKKVNPDGSYKAEAPLKLNDHGMDAMRYMVAYFDLGRTSTLMRSPSLCHSTVGQAKASRPSR